MSIEIHQPFKPLKFLITNIINLAAVFGIVYVLLPQRLESELTSSWWLLLVTFLGVHLFNAFVEYFVHRYVLHLPVVPFFKKFHKDHTLHHHLTNITKEGEIVSNEYPIVEQHQHEASFMPWFTFLIFSIFYAPFFIAVWLINPAIPIFLAGYTASFFSLAAYELSHAMFHWSVEKWHRLFRQPLIGPVWKIVYKHHMRHHVDIRYNESVSGFFWFPITDMVFGTHINAQTLFPHGEVVSATEFQKPKPSAFIQWLDKKLLSVAKF